jgi:hypothetical protein
MYYGHLPVPDCIGFVPNPQLVLPLYVRVEAHRILDADGQVMIRHCPRPLSIISGSEVVLQSSPDLLARYEILKNKLLF